MASDIGRTRALAIALRLLILSAAEYLVVAWIQHVNSRPEHAAAVGILSGHPHWIAYQSRLLGPALVLCVSRLAGCTFGAAYRLTECGLLTLGNATCFLLIRPVARAPAWRLTLMLSACFVALQDRHWLYLWDYVDVIVFMVLARLVVWRPNTGVLLLLFVLELSNRQSALFIAGWVVLDAVDVVGPQVRVRWARVVLGVSMGAAGMAWLRFITRRLYVSSTMVSTDDVRRIGDAMWMLPSNITAMSTSPLLDTIRVVFVLVTTWILLVGTWSELGRRAWKVSSFVGGMIVCTLLFGVVTETRVWIWVTPFWIWLACVARTRPSRSVPIQEA